MSYFKESDGLKYVMEEKFNSGGSNEFPSNKKDLIEKFLNLEKFLNENHHPNVNLGAAVSGDGVLTDHGVEHVQMVMEKAFNIIKGKEAQLKGYEIFLLLVAIHFHDLGNITGRKDHEKKIIDIMEEMGELLPVDDPEKEIISMIATAHGGYVDDKCQDKDTLRYVVSETFCNSIQIRPALLAAILRFADELSDDFNRAVNVSIPDENKIFHEYSKSLEPIGFSGKTLSFKYRIPYEKTKETMIKGTKKYYLYDEICFRLLKCLRELDYCRKYADGFIIITTLSVSIKINDPKNHLKPYDSDSFQLSLFGYPHEESYHLGDYIVDDKSFLGDNTLNDFPRPKYSSGEDLKNAIMKREVQPT